MDTINSAGFFSFPDSASVEKIENEGKGARRKRPTGEASRFTKKEKFILRNEAMAPATAKAIELPRAAKSKSNTDILPSKDVTNNSERSLTNALCAADNKRLQILLKNSQHEIDTQDPQMWVRLFTLACGIGDLACLTSLLPFLTNEQIEYRGRRGRTQLMNAVLNRDSGVVRTLLSAGASPHITDDFGENALSKSRHLAALSPAFEDLKNLCEDQQSKAVQSQDKSGATA